MTKAELVKEINEIRKAKGLKEENPDSYIKNTKAFLENKLEFLKSEEQRKRMQRLEMLLYNAITLLADRTIGEDDSFVEWMLELCDELGTTPTELKELGTDFDTMF
jgi:hypothetical protein